jgi:Glycosyl hydrolase-like 10
MLNKTSCFQSLSIFLSTVIFSNNLMLGTALALNDYCQLSEEEIQQTENLRQKSPQEYNILVQKHAEQLRYCRSRHWLQEQAIWLRLYSCDTRPGSIENILDRIVAKGYNTVYVEVFSDGQVLLPPNNNPTVWDSVIKNPAAGNVDLLAQAIEQGRKRGLKVYAWLFSLNFGYAYSLKPYRQEVLARNGKGQDSTSFVDDQSQTFVDPYNNQARQDYLTLLEAILQRRPDGVLFDYIRYPRGAGTDSVADDVKDLWIFSPASRQALINRGLNNKGKFLIDRYLSRGKISPNDIVEADQLYPQETAPLWQGRIPFEEEMKQSVKSRFDRLKLELWFLAVAHAAQGVIDYVSYFSALVERQGIPAGAVFFPDGNRIVGDKGFDSRLQAWDSFPASLEWHPMSYANCNDTDCVVNQAKRVIEGAGNQTRVIPALAGLWGQFYSNRPSLESQMEAIRLNFPRVDSISHFAFSWQEPEFDRARRFCKM